MEILVHIMRVEEDVFSVKQELLLVDGTRSFNEFPSPMSEQGLLAWLNARPLVDVSAEYAVGTLAVQPTTTVRFKCGAGTAALTY